MEDDHNFLAKWMKTSILGQIKNYLNVLANGRQPQVFG
jgi:hypothetical protein